MRCSKSLAWGSFYLVGYFLFFATIWTALKQMWPVLDHPLSAIVILAAAYMAMEKSVTFMAKRGRWSC